VKISAIVVSYAVRERLRRCLASMAADAARGELEVIVVDNGSADGSAAAVRDEFPWARLIAHPDNRGFAAAVNAAAHLAAGDAFLILNPDTEAPPGVAGLANRALEAFPRAGAVGFRQVDEHGMLQLSFGLQPGWFTELLRHMVQDRFDRSDHRLATWIDRHFATPRRVAWVSGATLLTPRAAFERAGGFDAGFFLFFEDMDYCLRLRQAGDEVWYEPGVTFLHHRGQSEAVEPVLAARTYRQSQLRFWSRHRGPMAGAAVALYQRVRGVST
jgi:hypothetical protein